MNLASLIDAHPADAVALVHDGATTTYGELRERAAAARGALTALGIVPGDRVGLALRNDPHFVAWWLAVLGAGAVAVPLNPSAPAPELGRAVNAALPRVAIVAEGVADAFESVEHVLEVGREVPLATAEAIVAREPGDVAVLLFTAGTAGSPKAAMLTHANLLTNQEQIQASGRGLVPDDVSLGVLPLFHIFGLNVVLGLTLRLGATVVLVERFDAAGTLDVVREHGVSVLAGAPPMYAAWSAGAGNDDAALASVRLAASGAAKLPVEVARRFEARFGVRIHEGYGLTEASPSVTTSAGDEPRFGSIGVPLPGVDVRLVDEEGEDALAGDPGEIWVRGPNVFAGYLEDPVATAEAITPDGWLRTGDIAVADDDGWLYIVDRAKDLVIVSGFNVFPGEVEEVLRQHPDIDDAGVVGAEDAHSGETVHAYVVPVAGAQLDTTEVIEFCARRLARYKCPTTVTVVAELPRNAAGKMLRRALPQ